MVVSPGQENSSCQPQDALLDQAHGVPQEQFSKSLAEALLLRPQEVLDDIAYAVDYYCVKGFDCFAETLLTSPMLSTDQKQAALKGSEEICSKVLAQTQQHMLHFKKTALATSLQVPTELLPSQAGDTETVELFEAEAELEVDQQLESLVRDIEQVCAAKQQVERETEQLKYNLACYGDNARLAAVTSMVAAGKENLSEDAATIAAMAQQLCPLLKRAELILPQRQENNAGQALQDAATLAEKEIVERQAAANGIHRQDLQRLGEFILAE